MQPETTKTLTTIRNSGARLLNLINDILDAAALRKVGPAELKRARYSPLRLASSALCKVRGCRARTAAWQHST